MKKVVSILLCLTMLVNFAFAASNISLAQTLAEDLKELNLFFGVSGNNDFDLERAPTRVEALVMLIRVLGKEDEALAGTWQHPFTDVPAWADKYVGYGYENGLANGVGYTTFGTGRANAAMYLTFVLRALGYTEAADGFTWDKPFDLARRKGILTNQVDTTNFLRADVVLVSYAALGANIKGQEKTLAEKLISAGVFTQGVFDAYYDETALAVVTSDEALNAEQIYEKCSPAVFYIEVYDDTDTPTGSGSGFFISSNGTAVTNYHVIEGASSAKITISDTQKTYKVKGVLNYSKAEDWAVIKVDGGNFPYMEIGDASTIIGGTEIFAIGSPLGLQNTISQGIISNVKRVVGSATYIQITAAISHGSSGGALINKYGQVIGITSASFEGGQSLNLAVPISKIRDYEGKILKTLRSIGGGSPSTSSGSSSSGTTGSQSDVDNAYNVLYTIATKYATYNDGDFSSWSGTREGGREELQIVYSRSYDMLFVIYTFNHDNGAKSESSILFSQHLTSDEFIYEYISNYGTKDYKCGAAFNRRDVTAEFSATIDNREYSGYLPSSEIENYDEMAFLATWLGLNMVDETMSYFTDGEWRLADLGYVNLYDE